MKRKSPISRIIGTLALPVAMYLIMMVLCYSHGKMYFGTWNMWKTLIVDIALFYLCSLFLTIYVHRRSGRQKKSSLSGLFILLLLAGCFFYFTLYPPDLAIFRDFSQPLQ